MTLTDMSFARRGDVQPLTLRGLRLHFKVSRIGGLGRANADCC